MIKSRKMRRVEYVARMGDTRRACRVLVGTSEGKGLIGIA
jgi:hypothetical protein